MKRTYITCCFTIAMLLANVVFSQDVNDAAYINTITQRSNKIVATLGIVDSAKFYRVQSILVKQYSSLNLLHEPLSASIKSIKKDTTIDKKTATEKIASIENIRYSRVAELHKQFMVQLSSELADEQVTKVKDGMTYNKVAVTYNGYVNMIPSLTEEQKTKIHGYLVEAREYAMDAESSEKKTEWFGKYKGRINNYLSAQGYDVKKEGELWQARLKAKEAPKQAQ